RVTEAYLKALTFALRHRPMVALCGLVSLLISVGIVAVLPTSFINRTDRGQSALVVELSPGATLDQTRAVVRHLTQMLMARSDVENVFATIGASGQSSLGAVASQGEVNRADLLINLKPRNKR